jgi:hypothetical protein
MAAKDKILKNQSCIVYCMEICVMCNDSYDLQTLTLEQKIIEDGDFCTRCWTELMEFE